MRVFARPFPMERLSLEARVLYTIFCLFMLFGVGTSFWLAHDSGLDAGTAAANRYYRGDSGSSAPASNVAPAANDDDAKARSADGDGPTFDLPDDLDGIDGVDGGLDPSVALHLEKPARQVVETFHFHAFTMPVCLLIIGHIFMMGAGFTRRKVVVIVVASVSTLLHLCLPPLIRFSAPSLATLWASLFGPSAIAMALSWAIMLIKPIWELWRPLPPRAPGPPEGDAASS